MKAKTLYGCLGWYCLNSENFMALFGVHHRRHEGRCEAAGQALQSSRILRHELCGILTEFEYVAKDPVVVLKEDLSGLGLGESDTEIHNHNVRGSPCLLIESHGNCTVAEKVTGYQNVTRIFGHNLESSSTNEFPAHGVRQTLLDSIRCRGVREGWYCNRLALASIQVLICQAIATP